MLAFRGGLPLHLGHVEMRPLLRRLLGLLPHPLHDSRMLGIQFRELVKSHPIVRNLLPFHRQAHEPLHHRRACLGSLIPVLTSQYVLVRSW